MYRLIYRSRSKTEITWDMVQQVMHTSEVHNEKAQVSGVLLATNTHFLQVLEGPYETVNETFMRIACDTRHDEMKLVSFNIIDARIFQAWGMLGIGIFDLNKRLETQLIKKYGEQDGELQFPLEEWKALAMIHDINLMSEMPEWKK
ncbi:MAG: BLUF domain-containing protein [Gammaproteobacteria bacterium]|nr:BLUF domain-containing protein [Gammaproteobacteria bacterium]MDX2485915.1 BLUF domain-containing protein [Gammaproteobacteria bacterium]